MKVYQNVVVTGNTVIDALLTAKSILGQQPERHKSIEENFRFLSNSQPMALITGHRRENFGQGFEQICTAIAQLADIFPEVQFVYPVHLNPNVQEPVLRLLSSHENVHLIEPQDYLPFVFLMNRATLILTDSGGIQEEAPALGRPVLVMRNTTERPEAISAGTARLIGTDSSRIISAVSELLTDRKTYTHMSQAANPYGDGHACERIVNFLSNQQGSSPQP